MHGPAFWVDWIYANVLLALGTLWLLVSLRQYPRADRPQALLLVAGVAAPWVGNLAYIFGFIPIKGLDPTPLGFAMTGVCFTVGLFRYQLFERIPIARTLLVDSLADAVFVLDPAWEVLDHNVAARTLAARDHLIGEVIDDLLPWWRPADIPAGPAGEPPRLAPVDVGAHTYNPSLRPVFDEHRVFAAWLLVVRDITERVRAEAARLDLERRLLEQQRVESLSVLARGLAHDFDNLLQSIVGNVELALMVSENEEVRDSLAHAISGARNAADLVAKMRTYSGQRPQEFAVVDLGSLASGMVGLLRRSVARLGTIHYGPPPAPVLARADPTQVRQILLNLIVNAAEASGETPCDITVRVGVDRDPATRPASVGVGGLDPARPYARIDVRDTGPGMDRDTAAHAFDPFFTTKATGRGLGLAAVRGIVLGHDGAVHVDSRPGAGTTFRVWLPLVEEPVKASEIDTGAGADTGAPA